MTLRVWGSGKGFSRALLHAAVPRACAPRRSAQMTDGTAHVTDGTAHVTDGTAHALHLHTLDLRLQPATSVRLHSRHLTHICSTSKCHVNMQEGSCKECPAYLTTLATCIACCALLPTWLSQQMET